MLTVGKVETEDDLHGILSLQRKNLPHSISSEELESQGFVTVVHTLDILRKMNLEEPSIIAKDANKVVGYCLAMTKNFKNDIPVLIPMFEQMDGLDFGGQKIADYHYIVSGQVCVDKEYRGQQLLDLMYQKYQSEYAHKYDLILTEISQRNTRSLKVHLRIGFQVLKTFTAEDGEVWDIVIWDWKKN
jgi:hypothetical protein